MASLSAFARDRIFTPGSGIKFGSLDFLANSTGELHLAGPDVRAVLNEALGRSTTSESERRRRGKSAATLKQCPSRPTASTRWQVGEAPLPVLEATTNHPQRSNNKRPHESSKWEVYVAEPSGSPRPSWLEAPIAYDRRDHLNKASHLGTYPLSSKQSLAQSVAKVLMDRGAVLTLCT